MPNIRPAHGQSRAISTEARPYSNTGTSGPAKIPKRITSTVVHTRNVTGPSGHASIGSKHWSHHGIPPTAPESQVQTTFYCNELGQLYQGIGKGTNGPRKQRIPGTEIFKVIRYQDIPQDRRKEVCHTKVVCEVRPQKEDPDITRITIGGNRIIYLGDVGTPTVSLELIKLILNSILSRPGGQICLLPRKIFYLATPMDLSEYARIKIKDIPEEFIKDYKLHPMFHNGWIYLEIVRG